MDSVSPVKEVSFEKALALLRKDVLVMDVHALMELLGDYMMLRSNFRASHNLRLEQESDVMMDVCKKELTKRGCTVSEFGNLG